jgi:uncharacterized ParB-like nuclease family protein
MIQIEEIAERLNAKPTRGKTNAWTACCPAHADRSPSLSLKLATNGNILMYCFAGCSFVEICDSMGIDAGDLFQEKHVSKYDKTNKNKAYISGDAMLELLYKDVGFIEVFASALMRNETPTEKDYAILSAATNRIRDAYFYAKSLK